MGRKGMVDRGYSAVPVADLFSEPMEEERLRITQVLYHEPLVLLEEKAGFVLVEAEEQLSVQGGIWRGYVGWIKASHIAEGAAGRPNGLLEEGLWVVSERGVPILPLPLGAKVRIVGEEGAFLRIALLDGRYGLLRRDGVRMVERKEEREGLLRKARGFLGVPYLWGGRSVPIKGWQGTRTGLDCSGFVNLLFRVCGLSIPRDANDQYLSSRKISLKELRPGDLLFLWDERLERVAHVVLYVGEGLAMEARGEGRVVEEVPLRERFGSSLEDIEEKDFLAFGRKVSAGRLIEDEG